jgi:hypothetical protein
LDSLQYLPPLAILYSLENLNFHGIVNDTDFWSTSYHWHGSVLASLLYFPLHGNITVCLPFLLISCFSILAMHERTHPGY